MARRRGVSSTLNYAWELLGRQQASMINTPEGLQLSANLDVQAQIGALKAGSSGVLLMGHQAKRNRNIEALSSFDLPETVDISGVF